MPNLKFLNNLPVERQYLNQNKVDSQPVQPVDVSSVSCGVSSTETVSNINITTVRDGSAISAYNEFQNAWINNDDFANQLKLLI